MCTPRVIVLLLLWVFNAKIAKLGVAVSGHCIGSPGSRGGRPSTEGEGKGKGENEKSKRRPEEETFVFIPREHNTNRRRHRFGRLITARGSDKRLRGARKNKSSKGRGNRRAGGNVRRDWKSSVGKWKTFIIEFLRVF